MGRLQLGLVLIVYTKKNDSLQWSLGLYDAKSSILINLQYKRNCVYFRRSV